MSLSKITFRFSLLRCSGTIECHEENNWDDVHPVLGQEGPVVLHLSLLLLSLVLLHPLDKGSSVRGRSVLHLLGRDSRSERRLLALKSHIFNIEVESLLPNSPHSLSPETTAALP